MADRLSKAELHERFVAAVGPAALVSANTDAAGELIVELEPPLPGRVRVYIYNATNPPGGRSSLEHKIQLILTGQRKGDRRNLDWSEVDFVLLCGYVAERDIFVFWDASLHVDFPHSKNLQVRTANVLVAAASGTFARQERVLRTGSEVVICAPRHLVQAAIAERASDEQTAGGDLGSSRGTSRARRGQPYTPPARDSAAPSKTRVFSFDPDAIDRGTNAHKDVQDQLAEAVSARGWQPLSPSDSDPLFDVAWTVADEAWIAEVKSLTRANEEQQLRLGLGQVLSYAYLVTWEVQAKRPVLAVEREPSASHWPDLCMTHGVVLSWPEVFDELLDTCA